MKRWLATQLRRLAKQLNPSYLKSYSVVYSRNEPVHVDIQFANRRVTGYVVPDHDVTYLKANT